MTVRILRGDCLDRLRELPDESVNCCVTSPPYWGLRDYGHAGQIGLESTPEEFVARLVEVFREVRRVLRDDGTAWVNLGDSYINHPASAVNRNGMSGSLNNGASDFPCRDGTRGNQQRVGIPAGLKVKDLAGIPWRVAFALQADGWYLRQDIIWHKPNPMPESVRDRCTKAHEYIFLLAKSERYYFDADAIAEEALQPIGAATPVAQHKQAAMGRSVGSLGTNQGADTRNKRSVWTVTTQPFKEAHFATFPPALIEPCILAGCPVGGTVLDPFGGAGTTGLVADRHQREAILIELNPEYADMAERRIKGDSPLFAEVA